MKVDWRAKLAISQNRALKQHMKDACSQSTDEEPAAVAPSVVLVLGATLRSLHSKCGGFIYGAIHLQQSEFYGNLPFTVLMTLQQSVVAERGRELGGFPSERAESILLGKGAKSAAVMPDSIFLGHRYSRTTPPFPFSLPVAVTHHHVSYCQPPANEYPYRYSCVMGLELDGSMCNKSGLSQERFLLCANVQQKWLQAAYLHLPAVLFCVKRNNSSHISQELGMTDQMMFEALLCTGAWWTISK